MDGRVQLPVIQYLQKRFNVEYVDAITDPGPNLILAENKNNTAIKSIFERINISVEKHHSKGIAIIGHHDCAGNPASKEDQLAHLDKAVQLLREQYEGVEVIGLWVDSNWEVDQVVWK